MRAAVTGILWINNKDKLVVAGFTPGSQAKQAGVVCGDILRKVDGRDVLKMKSEVCVWPPVASHDALVEACETVSHARSP